MDDGPDPLAPVVEEDPTKPKWEFYGERWFPGEHPLDGVTEDHRLAVEAYAMTRGQMDETARFAFEGGALQQPALLMDAWRVIGPIWRDCRKALEANRPRT